MRTTYRLPAPGEFQEMVKEESSLPWEARALDGLELPSVVRTVVHRLNFKFSLSSISGDKQNGETVG
jgi:hypothetical protein